MAVLPGGIDTIDGMKIAIAGYGAEGKASYEYYKARGDEVIIVDESDCLELPAGTQAILGADAFSDLSGFDLIVRSPGISPKKLPYEGKVWSATREFFTRCPAPVIGVTGTKGKGTTSSLIASILSAGDRTVHLVGNIGAPALEVLPVVQPSDIVVYELSSFQLWDLEQSPQIAVVLGIEPDHLDVHDSYEDYVAAKARIAEYQITTDRIVYDADNETASDLAKKSVGQLLPAVSSRTAHLRGDFFYYGETELCSLDNLQLVGEHNVRNACAAITAVWPWVQDGAVIAEGLRSFDGLPHRLKFVAEVDGVRYYDDSIATTPGSAIAALKAFSEPKVIILGGSSKGARYEEVIELAKLADAKVVAVGETGELIGSLCKEAGVTYERVEGPMVEVVKKAHEIAREGDVVILSPASASFDQYKNYTDRGEKFVAAVRSLM